MEDAPCIPLYQQILVVGMQKNIQGYTHWFHRQLDFRQLKKKSRAAAHPMVRLIQTHLLSAVPSVIGVIVTFTRMLFSR